ncbi:MAG: hypothetical protein MUE50_11190 [Pirellulaceae bacterium]|jgi:hypothetical protein|nr:hypothetical protein [Pirellulaceae bacterium]MCU0979841.1 hypothetical protein [Pirellulaceae bacterium]
MKRWALSLLVVVLGSAVVAQDGLRTARLPDSRAASGGQSEAAAALDRAAAASKFTFVFFWKEKNSQTDRAWSVLQAASGKMSDWAEVVAVQATDPAEKPLVDRFGTSRAPMPLVLAVAPCGAVTKAFTSVFDESQLQTAYVSPGTQLCLKALQDRKLVLLCVVDQAGPDGSGVPMAAQAFKADQRFGAASEIVLVSASDAGETGFLKELRVDTGVPKPFTVLLAPPGSVVGQFDSRATKDQMLAKLAAAQSNPCAGGVCGPGGCGPKK